MCQASIASCIRHLTNINGRQKKQYFDNLENLICTFETMKKQFKIVLIILVSFCYGNTVFEFSDTEKKVNFENESHVYVQQNHNPDFGNDVMQSFPHFDIISHTPYFFNLGSTLILSKDNLYFKKSFIPPPDRLFLLNSSFLI